MTVLEGLRVMSFNVLQMDGGGELHSWDKRKNLLAETIQLHVPDLLGTQEIFSEQSAFLLDKIPALQCFGSGRFGDQRDKHNSIFYNRHKFVLVDSGDLWFSRTPKIPGSSDWGIPSPRMVTWGRLHAIAGSDILILNTHLPYGREADEARRQAALVVLQTIASLPFDLPLFLTGDFNASADGEIHDLLTATLSDAWSTAAETCGPVGTFHGFGRLKGDRRMDWILHRNTAKTLNAETVVHLDGNLYPSDHYPVCATFFLDPVEQPTFAETKIGRTEKPLW